MTGSTSVEGLVHAGNPLMNMAIRVIIKTLEQEQMALSRIAYLIYYCNNNNNNNNTTVKSAAHPG